MNSYREKCISRHFKIKGKIKVYLDTKYWLILRDVQLGKNTCPKKLKIYKIIMELNKSKKVIFPISQYVLNEFVKQRDRRTLEESFNLILQLSENISIRTYKERIFEEVISFIKDVADKKLNFNSKVNNQHVWTSIPYSFGKFVIRTKNNDPFDEEVQRVVFEFESVDRIFLNIILEKSEDNGNFPDPTGVLNAKRSDRFKNTLKNQSFEFYSGLERGLVVNAFTEAFGSSYKKKDIETALIALNNLKYKNKLGNVLPTLNTYSTLLTTWLIEQNSKIKINHYFDIHHATAALPYFDIFLTENSLKDAIRRVTPKYLEFNKCTVGSTLEEAIEILISLK
ncbi:hypothetical protein [Pseudoalteromonas sp.]|uniref:hypothetical protein n=1 Tax=Pseudoalteromonas sp. TaxID=53249 RepID=UPI001BD19A21|nr:hypothetical protein [Pseudoalteromonas sp.]